MPKIEFPKKFIWGAATSAHQVEGGNFNDWSEWERANSVRLAAEAAKRSANASALIFPEMFKPENYISGRTAGHYDLFEKDFDLVKQLCQNGHRFSIEWSRIEPSPGNFNQKEIEHYRQVISALKQRGIVPFVTLWHWTIPVWLAEKGGWLSKDASDYFVRYCEKVVSSFRDEVGFWITLNEPMVYSSNSYFRGVWPPQKKNVFSYLRVVENLAKAHRLAHQAIHRISPSAKVGVAKNNIFFEGGLAAKLADWFWNKRFLDKIKNQQDFIGLNYYFHNRVRGFKFNQNENKEISDMGWEIYPEGIYYLLNGLKKYGKPIYITENGLADAKDEKRGKFIKEHLRWVHRAINEGVDARGYFYWSLLDNFEWDKGFWPRFGLIEVDYRTLERKIRPSAEKYAKICKENSL